MNDDTRPNPASAPKTALELRAIHEARCPECAGLVYPCLTCWTETDANRLFCGDRCLAAWTAMRADVRRQRETRSA